MKKRLTKWLKLLLPLCLSLLLMTGCGSGGALDLSGLKGEGGYAWPGLAWGSSPEEVSEQLGMTLENPQILYSKTDETLSEELYAVEDISFEGEKWRGEYQFSDGRLFNVDYVLITSPEKAEKLYDKIAAELEKQYGSPDEQTDDRKPQENGKTLDWHAKDWIASGPDGETKLWIARWQLDGDKNASISFGVICPQG